MKFLGALILMVSLGYSAKYIQISMNGSTANIGNHLSEIVLYKGNTKLDFNNISVESSTNDLTTFGAAGISILFDGVHENGIPTATKAEWAHPGDNAQTFVLTLNDNHDFDRLWIAGYSGDVRTYTPVTIGISNDGVAYATKTHEFPGSGGFFEDFQGALGISVTVPQDSVGVGDTLSLEATVEVLGGVDNSVTWSSSDESVAVVTADGKVIAVAEGTAQIRAASSYNSILSKDTEIRVVAASAASIDRAVALPNANFAKVQLFDVHGKEVASYTGNASTWKKHAAAKNLSGVFVLKVGNQSQKVFVD